MCSNVCKLCLWELQRVLPNMKEDDGIDDEIMYMTTKFERVVGSRDCEAFYMMNPNGT